MNEIYDEFFKRLNDLSTGDRAALRRARGEMIQDANAKVLMIFYRCLPAGVPQYKEECWFAIACLRCLWDAGENGSDTLPDAICKLCNQQELSESIRHRVEALMDTSWDHEGYMLRKLYRLIVLVRQKLGNEIIDFVQLLNDLLYWNAENQQVQRRWARELSKIK